MTTLYLDASVRYYDAAASRLATDIVTELGHPVIYRPTTHDLMYHADLWADAHFTQRQNRTDMHREALEMSQILAAELTTCKTLVIGTAIYNHSVPSALKAWLKLITMGDEIFDADMSQKRAVLVMASGGKKFGTQFDHAIPYLQSMLEMIGFGEIEFVSADQPADATTLPVVAYPVDAMYEQRAA